MPTIDKKKDDVDQILPIPQSIKTVNGDSITVPQVTLRKEALVSQQIAIALKDAFGKDFALDEDARKNFKVTVELLKSVLERTPERLVTMASVLLSTKDVPRDVDWVQDNLRLVDVVNLLVPFFGVTISELRSACRPLGKLLAGEAKKE